MGSMRARELRHTLWPRIRIYNDLEYTDPFMPLCLAARATGLGRAHINLALYWASARFGTRLQRMSARSIQRTSAAYPAAARPMYIVYMILQICCQEQSE